MKVFFAPLAIFWAIVSCAQPSGPGSGYCLEFDGANTRVIISDSPIFDHPDNNLTIEAWIFPTGYGGVIFGKHHTMGTREYTIQLLPDGRIRFDVFNNSSTDYLTFSLSTIPLNTWTHVAGTYTFSSGTSRIYINGILDQTTVVGSVVIASTSIPPLIGAYWLSPPNTSRAHFTGIIDEVRLWHSVRSQTEIRDNMCRKLVIPQVNLIANYRIDEPDGLKANDASGNTNNGTLQNFAAAQITSRSFSGAPIGDISTYVYANDWSGVNLSLSQGSFTVSDISNTPVGFHLYRVDTLPNSELGILDSLNNIYYGTFIVNGSSTTYTVVHDYNFLVNCFQNVKLHNRDDNSDLTWVDMSAVDNSSAKVLTKNNIGTRGEFILGYFNNGIDINLGNDTSICSGSNLILNPGSGYSTYTWHDGSNNQTFSASTIGKYWVRVSNSDCTGSDTLNIDNLIYSPGINLGKDTSICIGGNIIVDAGPNYVNYQWQDNSTSNTFSIFSSGIYWVTVNNNCGMDTDSIEVSYLNIFIPNLITSNNDLKNDSFIIYGAKEGVGKLSIFNRWGAKVYYNNNYNNDWNGQEVSDDIYYYKYDYPGCVSYRGWVQLLK